MPIVGRYQTKSVELKAGEPKTVMQLVGVPYRAIRLQGARVGIPDYGMPETGPPIAWLHIALERQRGGAFANMGLTSERVSGADRPGEPLQARYRTGVLEEPETVEVLGAIEGELRSKGIVDVIAELGADGATVPALAVPPEEVVGLKITSRYDQRIWFVVMEHEE